MSIAAIIPVGQMQAANDSLEAQGYGPGNFSVPAYDGARPTHAAFHCWGGGAFADAVKAIPNVQWSEGADDPPVRMAEVMTAAGAEWPANAPLLPDTGVVRPGEYYRIVEGDDTRFWRVIQQHNRGTFGGDPEQYPSLIREARIPGRIREWKQPTDQFDAYLTLNPFTGEPDRVIHEGATWECTQGSAGGPGGAQINTWEPGVFGWVQV